MKDNQPLTMTALIQNTGFFKKLYNMKEFTDNKLKKYLEEINKNNGTENDKKYW